MRLACNESRVFRWNYHYSEDLRIYTGYGIFNLRNRIAEVYLIAFDGNGDIRLCNLKAAIVFAKVVLIINPEREVIGACIGLCLSSDNLHVHINIKRI